MRRWCCFGWFGCLLLLSPGTAGAQLRLVPNTPIVEIGGQVMVLQFEGSGTLPRATNIAGGLRVTFNLSDWFAVENQTDVYPRDTFLPGLTTVQSVFGFKAGVRGRWGGIFATFRPGFMVHGRDWGCGDGEDCNDWRLDDHDYYDHHDSSYEWWFAVNTGAAAELYPSPRFVARVDVGDTFVRRRIGANTTGRSVYSTSHNLQTSVGGAVRF